PGVVVGFMVILLAGRQGLIGQIAEWLTGENLVFAYSMAGLFLGYLYFSIPRVILTVMAAAEKRSEEHTSELQSLAYLVCRLLLDTTPTHIYPLSLHDALPISGRRGRLHGDPARRTPGTDRPDRRMADRREPGVCLFNGRTLPRLPVLLDPARDPHGDGGRREEIGRAHV